jgi:dolichol-phosphate mannosyltransferase
MNAAQTKTTPRGRELPESISVVVPCFNEEAVMEMLRSRLTAVLSSFNLPYEIVLVDDGSRDKTWEIMQRFQAQDNHFKVVKLARNFGHQLALTCGLDQAHGEVVLIMDGDLQDPPELLPEMLKLWSQGYDVVYGKRKARLGESWSKRLFAFLFYRIFEQLTGITVPRDTGDFRLMDRTAVTALQSLRERHRFIRGLVSWIGYQQTPIYYDRPERAAGNTKYPFKKSLFLALDAITSFSYAPLRFASYLGLALSVFSFIYIVVVLALKIAGINFPGYTSIMASVLLLGGVQLMVLGLIGEYVGRIFEQGQNRPLYLIDQVKGEPLQPGKS